MNRDKLRLLTIFGLTFYLLSLMAPAMISWSGIETLTEESQSEEPDNLDESSNPAFGSSHDVGNYSRGGYHLATGDWWEPRDYSTTISDWDGDGVANTNDTHPLNPALPSLTNRSSLCYIDDVPCTNEPISTVVNTPKWISSNLRNTRAIAWGDIDGEGTLDLVVGNYGDKNEVYLNSGTALANTPAWTSSNSLASRSLALGDVDGDGDLDLAVGNWNGNNEVYLNNGEGFASSPSWISSNSLTTQSVAWGDVDGDGDLDLAVGNDEWTSSAGNNEVYLNNGTALAITPAWTSSNSRDTMSVAWGDVDGDGDLDLAVGNYDGENNEIYLNSGTALATTPAWTSSNSLDT
jgi:hypothetical protein